MLTAAALAFLVNLGGALFNWFFQKAGRVATQAVLFVLALIGAVYWQFHGLVPGLQNTVIAAAGIFSLAVTFYEVILNYFPAFKGPTTPTS